MTAIRKAGKQSAARRAAREQATVRAAEFRRRESALEELAVEYFVTLDEIEDIEAEAARQIADAQTQANAAVAKIRREAADITRRMLAEGVTRGEVAKRLGIAVRDVAKPTNDGSRGRGSVPATTPPRDTADMPGTSA